MPPAAFRFWVPRRMTRVALPLRGDQLRTVVRGGSKASVRAHAVELDRVHRAFGSEVQLALELEGWSTKLLNYYRPNKMKPPVVTDAKWKSMTLDARAKFMKKHGIEWNGLVRMDDAPAWLSPTVKKEVNGCYEIKTDGFVRTLGELFHQMNWLHRNVDENGGMHFHVSFELPPVARKAERIQASEQVMRALMHGNEYAGLRIYARNAPGWLKKAGKGVSSKYVTFYNQERIDQLSRSLPQPRPQGNKMSTLSLRTGIYGNDDRVGLELRGFQRDPTTARRALANLLRYLEDPEGTPLKFGLRGNAVHPELDVSHLSADSVNALEAALVASIKADLKAGRIPEEKEARTLNKARSFLSQAASAASRQTVAVPLAQRWSVPMVAWEDRAFLPAKVKKRLVKSREAFVQTMKELVVEYSEKKVDARAQERIEAAVTTWAKKANIHEYF